MCTKTVLWSDDVCEYNIVVLNETPLSEHLFYYRLLMKLACALYEC